MLGSRILTTNKPALANFTPSITHRKRATKVAVVARGDTYVAPSSRTGATELGAIERFSEVVPDVVLSQNLSTMEQPKAATISRGVLVGMINNPVNFQRYKIAVEQSRYYDRCKVADDKMACMVDKALVNVGGMMAETVSGRISTEIDPKLAHDTDALIARGRQLMDLYRELGLSKDRIILRMPATWEAIQAAKQLEAEGIATHLVLVYSFAQGAAAAAAGVSVIQPNIGKLDDWYTQHPGVPRDPKAPRESLAMAMAGYGTDQANPGVLLVEKLYCYCKRFQPKTRVMASGIRNKDEAMALAGCDYLVIGPKVLDQLEAMPTLEGYNDSLRATADDDIFGVEPGLSLAKAEAYEFEEGELDPITAENFKSRMELPGRELLEQGLKRLQDDADRLEPFFDTFSGGQE